MDFSALVLKIHVRNVQRNDRLCNKQVSLSLAYVNNLAYYIVGSFSVHYESGKVFITLHFLCILKRPQ